MAEFLPITFGGITIQLTGEGMLWLPDTHTLVASDIHFEKSTFFSRFATFLPPYDSAEILDKLAAAIAKYQPQQFIALGDSFHDAQAVERLEISLLNRLNALIDRVGQWQWITGNHDPQIGESVAGNRVNEVTVQNIIFRHEAAANETRPEISGHYHPKASIALRGTRVSGACFLQAQNRLIMPAFGSFTGGLDINHVEITKFIPADVRQVYLLQQNMVFALNPLPVPQQRLKIKEQQPKVKVTANPVKRVRR